MTPKGTIIVHHMNEAALRSHQARRDDALSRHSSTLFAELKLMRCGSETGAPHHERSRSRGLCRLISFSLATRLRLRFLIAYIIACECLPHVLTHHKLKLIKQSGVVCVRSDSKANVKCRRSKKKEFSLLISVISFITHSRARTRFIIVRCDGKLICFRWLPPKLQPRLAMKRSMPGKGRSSINAKAIPSCEKLKSSDSAAHDVCFVGASLAVNLFD
jgi:hypothetical protein